MGMSSGNKSGLQSEINVTPLIDVLLVLLIIFLVVMPIMMKMETLQVPRNIDSDQEMPDPNASMLTVFVKPDLTKTLRPKLEAMSTGNEKVVFVDFHEAVPWKDVVGTMDSIRSLAADVNHDEIKVALKVKEADEAKAQP